MLDLDPLVAHRGLFLDRMLDEVARYPVSPLGGAFADLELFLDDRDHFLALAAHIRPRAGTAMIREVAPRPVSTRSRPSD